MKPAEPFGPKYPDLGTSVAKWRKIKQPTAEQRQAHGEAVGAAIRALQWCELQRELPSITPSCASGTWHNNADGKIGEAIRAKYRRALLAYPDKVRRARSETAWRKMYADVMGWSYVQVDAAVERQREIMGE